MTEQDDRESRRITDLAAATPGWRAVYRRGNVVLTRSIAVWALVEMTGPTSKRRTVGMVTYHGEPVFADALEDRKVEFRGYASPEDEASAVAAASASPDSAQTDEPSCVSSWFG